MIFPGAKAKAKVAASPAAPDFVPPSPDGPDAPVPVPAETLPPPPNAPPVEAEPVPVEAEPVPAAPVDAPPRPPDAPPPPPDAPPVLADAAEIAVAKARGPAVRNSANTTPACVAQLAPPGAKFNLEMNGKRWCCLYPEEVEGFTANKSRTFKQAGGRRQALEFVVDWSWTKCMLSNGHQRPPEAHIDRIAAHLWGGSLTDYPEDMVATKYPRLQDNE